MGRKKLVMKKEVASPIYENAIDSLRIGMEFFLKEDGYSSRKHAILTVFHAIELLLKERLAQTNPILIYKNIDAKITDDAMTVGVREALTRGNPEALASRASSQAAGRSHRRSAS
jgi:hypothetical protein